jgi:hypothetical protein
VAPPLCPAWQRVDCLHLLALQTQSMIVNTMRRWDKDSSLYLVEIANDYITVTHVMQSQSFHNRKCFLTGKKTKTLLKNCKWEKYFTKNHRKPWWLLRTRFSRQTAE